MLKYAIFAGALLCCKPSAYAQETQAAAAQEPSVAHLMSLIDDQKDRIESQAKRIQELEDRMKKVEELALASHNRLQDQEDAPRQQTTSDALEERLAQLERSVQGLSELPTDVVEAGDFPGSFRIPGTDAALKIGGQVQMTVVKTFGQARRRRSIRDVVDPHRRHAGGRKGIATRLHDPAESPELRFAHPDRRGLDEGVHRGGLCGR